MAKQRTPRRTERARPEPMTPTRLRAALADLEARQRRLAERMAADLAGYVTPAVGGQMRLQDSDIEYLELWAEVHWTAEAAERIRADEFRYISPEFDLEHHDPQTDEPIGAALLAIGLVTRPFLKGMAAVEDPDADDVSDVMVMKTGSWFHDWYGKITITPESLQQMVDNVSVLAGGDRHEPTELVVDYNHMSLGGGPDESKAAGWVRGAGLRIVRPQGQRVAATEPPATVTPPTPDRRQKIMNDDRVRAILQLAADAEITDALRAQAFDAIDAQLTATSAELAELRGTPEPEPVAETEAETEAEPEPLAIAATDTTAAQLADVDRRLKEHQAHDAADAAHRAGKLTGAQMVWAEAYALADPAGFAAFVETAPKVVDTGRDGSNGRGLGAGAAAVREFITAKTDKGMGLAQAQALALAEFGTEQFAEYRRPNA